MTGMPPLALLAGGMATRLGDLTRRVPKSMLEVAGEPFIAHQLRLMAREGVTRAVLCVGHLSDQIADFVGDGRAFGLDVIYRIDGPVLLGTGGALRTALPDLGPEFLVMYGDSWLDVAFAPIVEAFRASRMPALMTVFRNSGQWDRSNVLYENERIVRYTKTNLTPDMRHIDWGLGVLRSEVLAGRPAATKFDLAEVYEALVADHRLAGYEVSRRFYEIGSAEGLRETDALLRGAAGRTGVS
jgi:NDP-sugar pyrophosphorylase family protein